MDNDGLTTYTVWYLASDAAEGDDALKFVCQAEDTDHAREQCRDAEPGCAIAAVES